MDNNLWIKIAEFDLDHPISEYGFSTRIANENYWTVNFTRCAIVEYKKFMYLAATSDLMVSPSPIIDIVWHEHLIFTQSYNDFCAILGKKIEHIPATRNRQDIEKFRTAKERTAKLYEINFGKLPVEIWSNPGMFESLSMEKSKIKLRTFLLLILLSFLILILPIAFILKPLYAKIDNPYFIIGFISLSLISSILMGLYSNKTLSSLVAGWNKNSFIFKLSPMELGVLREGELFPAIHDSVNQMVKENKISISANKRLSTRKNPEYNNAIEYTILETLKNTGAIYYPVLLNLLLQKPVFGNVSNSMNAVKKYFTKSKLFVKLFSLNFIVLAAVLMLGFARLLTGIVREKPITVISISLAVYLIFMGAYLFRFINLLTTTIIPQFYETSIIPALTKNESRDWRYFLLGNSVLAATFIPLVLQMERNNNDSPGSGGSSCGSGCGSSCNSCGGCGGGD